MKSSTPNLDYLRERVIQLKCLLDDPQPGLASWVELYAQRMQHIADFWSGNHATVTAGTSMMKTIWKFPIKVTDRQNIMMPEGAQILAVQMQGSDSCLNNPHIWAAVDSKAPLQRREIEVIGTGNPVEDAKRTYIGTFQQDNGRFVWHVFERIEP